MAVAVVACAVVLAVSDHAALIVGVQIALTLIVVAVSIPVMRRLHDAVPSTIRAGVASGVGTLTWLAFVPFALAFGAVSESVGLDRGALLFVAVAVAAAALMLVVLPAVPAVSEEAGGRRSTQPRHPAGVRGGPFPPARRPRLARPLGASTHRLDRCGTPGRQRRSPRAGTVGDRRPAGADAPGHRPSRRPRTLARRGARRVERGARASRLACCSRARCGPRQPGALP